MIKSANSTEQVDVVLVVPPSSMAEEFGLLCSVGAPRPPLNLLNLGAVLLENGYSVKIVDGAPGAYDFDTIVDKILSYSPRFVGITSMTGFIHASGIIADKIKMNNPEVVIIIGGVHVSALPLETMNDFPGFDVGVVGEGDITIVELVNALEKGLEISKIPGLVIRSSNGPELTEYRERIKDIDTLPLPAWHLLPDFTTTYQPTGPRKTRLPSAYIVTSRGCPFKCSFCCNIVHGNTFRSYSVDYMMKTIDFLIQKYKVKDLTIYDENIAFPRRRIEEFCKRLIKADYDLTWSCDARADRVDAEILELMHKAGCRSIWFGIESGSPEMLKRYNKKTSLETIKKTIKLCSDSGINAAGSFIIGGPCDTPKRIKETIRFAKRIPLSHFIPFYYLPVPGAPDYPNIHKCGIVKLDYRLATMSKPIFAPHGMTLKDIQYWYMRALIEFYGRPAKLVNYIRQNGIFSLLYSGFSFLSRGVRQIMKKRHHKH
jgi:radical SAM superfamily enzyme YgiQ (UPF0313 family)